MTNNRPLHADESDQIMQTIARLTDNCKHTHAWIFISLGKDGRPYVVTNIDDPQQAQEIMRELGEMKTSGHGEIMRQEPN